MVRTPVAQQHQSRTPPQQFRTEFRCSPTSGRQWTVQVPITPVANPHAVQSKTEWRIDPQTGERWQVLTPSTDPLRQSSNQQSPYNFVQPSTGVAPNLSSNSHVETSQQFNQSSSQLLDQSNDVSLSRQERVAGIVSLLEGGGVTKKVPKVLELAKKCPTKWSKQATLANINLPLYAWGVLEEVEASLSGRSQAFQSTVILGKLRHLKNTLEVCCQNSTSQEYSGFGWTLAKDYSTKVHDEIDQGRDTWQDLKLEVKTSTLMAASMEHPRPTPKAPFEPKLGKKVENKDACRSYNTCSTESKCDFEVANPSKTCPRKHECSWCRANKNQSWNHQVTKCRNKAAHGSS